MHQERRLGLGLSGGGYRAAAFHLGTLRKLHALGILEKIDVLSTISGGSIAGVYYLLHKDDFEAFDKSFCACLTQSVIRRILVSWRMGITLLIAIGLVWGAGKLGGFLGGTVALLLLLMLITLFHFTFIPLNQLKIKAYRRLFFGDKCLKDLPDTPEIAINATNLDTGTLWTYSKRKMGDSSYDYRKDGGQPVRFKCYDFPLASAVGSSTAVPAFFAPLTIDKRFYSVPEDAARVRPSLSDGGIYDNQGIHKLSQDGSSYRCDIIICSDGSEPFRFSFRGINAYQVLYRANDIMMRKIKSMQFIRDVYGQKGEIAYFSLDWQYENCISGFVEAIVSGKICNSTLDYHNLPKQMQQNPQQFKKELATIMKAKIGFEKLVTIGLPIEEIREISRIKTGLSAFSEARIEQLARHAGCLTEIQVRLYCPTLLEP